MHIVVGSLVYVPFADDGTLVSANVDTEDSRTKRQMEFKMNREPQRYLSTWVGHGVGMNRWGVRREWCRGQERERKTLQHVTT